MDVLEILQSAREKIANPENWGKGMRTIDRPYKTCCAAEAIEDCSLGIEHDATLMRTRVRAYQAIANVAGLDRNGMLSQWNDAPERTHREVLAAFDLAIATLKFN
jgi:hypothetical protein